MSGTSKTMLNKSGENEHPLSSSLSYRKCFHLFIIEYDVSCGLVIHCLYYVEVCSLYAYFWPSFYYKWMLNFIKSFFCIGWDDHMVFIPQFVNVMLSHSLIYRYWKVLISWDKSHSIIVYHPFDVLLDSVWIHILLRIFTLCSSVILAYNFVFWYLFLVLVSGCWWPHRMNLGVFLTLQFLGIVSEG